MNIKTRLATIADIPQIQLLLVASIQQLCSKDYTPAQINAWVTAGTENTAR